MNENDTSISGQPSGTLTGPPNGSTPIAVVGMSGYFPQSPNIAEFWRHICAGDDLLSEVPESHWLKEDYSDPSRGLDIPSTRGGFLPWLDFDPVEFGIPPAQLKNIDSVQLLTLLAMKELLGQLDSLESGSVAADRISVILGVAAGTELIGQMSGKIQRGVWTAALRNEGVPEEITKRICDRIEDSYADWNESTFPGLLANVVAGRITNRFDFGGTNCTVDAACASSLAAMTMGIYELQLGVSDLVIGGGADALNDPFMHMCFSRTFALSKNGECRPFDAEADGTLLGEGIGLIALRRLEDAERDGDEIHAVIRGYGSSSDGRHKSIYAPRPAGQEKALRRAYERAGVEPESIELVEAHGTGTIAGDAAECASLKAVYTNGDEGGEPWCGLGSVKSQIGHTKSAAGAAAVIKTILGLRHGVLPPTIKVGEPGPSLELDGSPFYLNTTARPWIPRDGKARRAAVSSFGFGGSNYHFVLEEYSGEAPASRRIPRADSALLLASAADEDGLAARIDELSGRLDEHEFVDVAAHSQIEFDSSANFRCGVVARDAEEATRKLSIARERVGSSDDPFGSESGAFWARGEVEGKVAFMFPGQGSQYPGMGGAIVEEFEAAQEVWSEGASNSDLANVVFPRPGFDPDSSDRDEEILRQTENAQPAIGLTSAAMLAVLDRLHFAPDIVAGHSYGEITSLYAAGVIPDLNSFMEVSRRRGELLGGNGRVEASMLAVLDSVESVRAWIEESGEKVAVANDNAPRQVVVAGEISSLDRFAEFLSHRKISCRRLNVSNAFHSEFVADKAPEFVESLSALDWKSPGLPVFSNVMAGEYEPEPSHLGEQIKSPVRFREMVEGLYGAGARIFVEVGPHSVLTGLVSKCLEEPDYHAIPLDSVHDGGLASFWEGLGRIAVLGKALDFSALWDGFAIKDVSIPPPQHSPATVQINGANFGKPYPPKGGASALPPPVTDTEMPHSHPTPESSPEPKPPVDVSLAQGEALLAIQRSALDAQRSFQETLERSHRDFLRMTEGMIQSLGGEGFSKLPPLEELPATETFSTPAALPEPAPVAMPEPAAEPLAEPIPQPQAQPAPAAEPASNGATVPGSETVSDAAVASNGGKTDFTNSLLEVVSESTGYPIEMLDLDQELESGLGIDSIKRVEILSSLQQHHPEVGNQDTNQLASLRTLREIVEFSTGGGDDPEQATSDAPVEASADGDDFETALLEVVSESTGYPIEMLDLDQELESGLGIDSIKRVEILSALQERFPKLADEDTNQVAALRTLGEIVALVKGEEVAEVKEEIETETPAAQSGTLHRYVLEAVPESPPGLAMAGLQDGETIYIVEDSSGVAGHLAGLLEGAGIETSIVAAAPENATHLILLQGLGASSDSDDGLLLSCFDSVKACANAMAESGRFFVTAQDTGGRFGMAEGPEERPFARGGVGAFARTLRREWPGAAVKAIDIESGGMSAEEIAGAIYRELMLGADQLEVGLSSEGDRFVTALQEVAVERSGESRFVDGDVVVVTGGARGVTSGCVEALAGEAALKIAILGRTELEDEPDYTKACRDEAEIKSAILEEAKSSDESPSLQEVKQRAQRILAAREVEASLDSIRERGSEAIYIPCDVARLEDVEAALDRARSELGPIKAVVHAAGVLRDGLLASMTRENFEIVLRTKVEGLRNLLSATTGDPLHTLCCFSSIAARVGNAGQLNYNVANEVLNKVCQAEKRLRGEGFLAKSIAWGPWEGGMVTPHLRKHFEELGVSLIPFEAGSNSFVEEVQADPEGPVEVVVTGTVSRKFLEDTRDSVESGYLLRGDICPYLKDHQILANAVMPVTMAIELALRSSGRARTDHDGAGVRLSGIHVLKGVQAPEFESSGNWLTLRAGPNGSEHSQIVEIQSREDRLNYQIARDRDTSDPLAPADPPSEMEEWDWSLETIYRTRALLFHGPEFHVLKSLEKIGEWGCTGIVERPHPPSGPELDWSTDLFVLDGGLQLGVLWVWKHYEKHVLPTRVDHVRFFRSGLLEGPIRCIMKTRSSNDLQSSFDVWWLDESGDVLVYAEGVQMTHIPTSWIPEEIAGKSTSYYTESAEEIESGSVSVP